MCLPNWWGSFYLTTLSTACDKVCEEIFCLVFLDFWVFFKKYPPKSGTLSSMDRTGCGKLPWLSDCFQTCSHKKLWPSENTSFWFFGLFLKLFDFSQKLHSWNWDLVSMWRCKVFPFDHLVDIITTEVGFSVWSFSRYDT